LGAAIIAITVAFAVSPYGSRLALRWISDAKGGVRLLLWRDTLGLIQKHWIAGSGPDTFGASFPPYESLSLARRYPEIQLESAHNVVLDAASGQGLPGVLFLAGVVALAWIWTRRTPREHRDTAALLLGGIVASIAFHQFFSFVLPNYLMLMLLLGALASLAGEQREPLAGVALWPKSLSISAAGVLVAFGLVLAAFTLQVSFTDSWFAKIQRFLRKGDVEGAVRAYGSAQRWRWAGDAPLLWYAQQMAEVAERVPAGQLQTLASIQALSAVELASRVDDEDQVFAVYQRAVLLVRTGEFQQAEGFARQAAAADPMWYRPHLLLSQLLTRAGQYPEALIEARAAHEILSTANSPAFGEAESLLRVLQQKFEPAARR